MGNSIVIKVLDKRNSLHKFSLLASRFSLLASRFSLLVNCFFVLLLASNISAQIIIKEKVEINPQSNIVPDYPVAAFTPCGPWITSYDEFNPWQVVWNQISFAPDPYQQMFNFQDNRFGPGLQRRTYILDPSKNYNLTIQQSDEYAYFTYGGFYDNTTGSYIPVQYVGSTLSGVLGSDIGATGWYDYVQDYPNGLYNNDSKYRMRIKRDVPSGTEITMSVFDGQTTINYHTRIETPTFTIESITDEDTLLHYYSRDIEFRLNFQQSGGNCQLDGYGGAYPVGVKFNVEIVQGQEYGNLYYPGTVSDPEQSGTSITDISDEYGIGVSNYSIKYKADGVQPDSLTPGIVTIRCSANDLDIAPVEVSFPVKYNTDPPEEGGIILFDFNKESFIPGDTATTNCKWLTAYNELLDFPAEQSFNVEITGGSEFGMLLDPNTGTVSDNLQGVSNGFKVITATSIPYDSVVIRIKVNTSIEVNNAARMITNQNPKSEIKENNIADNDDGTQTIIPDFFIGNPGQEIEGFAEVVVKKDECDEEIVVCENLDPQKIDSSNFHLIGANHLWTWQDLYGNPYSTYSNSPCNSEEAELVVAGGATYSPSTLGTAEPKYKAFQDIHIETCLTQESENNKMWYFKVYQIRIPVIQEICFDRMVTRKGLVDLEDGLNVNLLANHIPNCEELGNVLDLLTNDILTGPYVMKNDDLAHSIYSTVYMFSGAFLAHENVHLNQLTTNITEAFNSQEGLSQLLSENYKINHSIFMCPRDAIEFKRKEIQELLTTIHKKGKDLQNIYGVNEKGINNAELLADIQARPEIEKIIRRIKSWAKSQDWWDGNNVFCSDYN